jgi:hypothetical protein
MGRALLVVLVVFAAALVAESALAHRFERVPVDALLVGGCAVVLRLAAALFPRRARRSAAARRGQRPRIRIQA